MAPEVTDNQGVRTFCDRCRSVTTFERNQGGSPFGSHGWYHTESGFVGYALLRCAGCSRGGIAELRNPNAGSFDAGVELVDFYPTSIETVALPPGTPEGVRAEFEEAERCANAGAFRAASAMLRSALEKVVVINGYTKGKLYDKIERAAADGVLTEARRRQAHTNVRSLGNDVVHEAWRLVPEDEFELAYRYTQRVIEDFYESRDAVVGLLTEKKRLPAIDGAEGA